VDEGQPISTNQTTRNGFYVGLVKVSRVRRVIAVQGLGGFWNDDNEAIKRGAESDGFAYKGKPVTPGFTSIRQPAQTVGITFMLDDRQLAFGDCIWVQYGGERAGREKLLPGEEAIQLIHQHIEPWISNRELESFQSLSSELDDLDLPMAVKYGVSQAILDAVAKSQRMTMTEVLAREYGTKIENQPLRFFTQSGDNYYYSVDKMILRRIPVFPHGLINSVARLQKLLDYVKWTNQRIRDLVPDESYNPTLHYDVYGNLGLALKNDVNRMIEYLAQLEEAAKPYRLQVEDPVLMSSKADQIKIMSEIRKRIKSDGLTLKLVADEWVPTLEDKIDFIKADAADIYQIKPPDLGGIEKSVEAILYCKSQNVEPYLGGSCTETATSAQVCVHIGLATRPVQVLAKPGMGVDEGVSIMYNEVERALALIFGSH